MKNNIVKWLKKLLVLFLLTYSLSAYCQNSVVIVTGTNYIDVLTIGQLMNIYKGDVTEISNGVVSFLDHDRNTQIYKDFLKQYFNLTDEQMQKYWEKMKLEKGTRPPKFLPDAFLAKALITIKGSISYYYENKLPPNVTVVKIIK